MTSGKRPYKRSRRVRVFLEGGGDGKASRLLIAQGMNGFLKPIKDKAQTNRWHWDMIACGSRREAYERFRAARDQGSPNDILVLLVDAEAAVTMPSRIQHLSCANGDKARSSASSATP